MPRAHKDSKFTQENINKILDMIFYHVPYKKACVANGVSERIFYYWLQAGERDIDEENETEYASFVKRLRAIESNKIKDYVKKIELSEAGHRGAEFLLERVYWQYFSKSLSEKELSERIEKLERRRASEEKNLRK